MRTVVWILGAVVLVDVSIVAWFVLREVIEARHVRRELGRLDSVRREIEYLDALWRAPAVPQLRLVHSATRRASRHGVVAGEVATIARPVLGARPRARQASFAAFAAAMTALLIVLAFDASAPSAERAATASSSSPLTQSSEPDLDGDDGGVGTTAAGASASAPPVTAPPSVAGGSTAGGIQDLPAPDRVAADARSTDRIVLAWEPVPDAIGYEIERWETPVDAEPGWKSIGETQADATTYVDTDLEPGTTYYYRVSALTEDGPPAPSDVVSATTLPGPPDAPVIAAASNGSTVKIEWGDVSNETGYRVERLDPSDAWVAIATVGQDVTVYVDGSLEKGTSYSYRVIATNDNGESPPSNVASATPGSEDGASTDPDLEDVSGGADSIDEIDATPTEEVSAPASAEPTEGLASSDEASATVDGSTTIEGSATVTTSEDGAVSEPVAEG